MFYEAGGTQLFFTAMGAGHPVVLLHPMPLDHRFWLPVAERLKDRYRLIMPDLRGHGWSQLGDKGITVQRLGLDVQSLLDHLQIESASFIGCSLGGYALFEVWREFPERVKSFVFCCSKPQPDTREAKAKREATITMVRTTGVARFFDSSVENLVSETAKRDQPHLVPQVHNMMMLTAEAIIKVQEGLADRPDSMETAASISVPTLVIAGEEDKASTPAEVEALVKILPHAEYHLVQGTGHLAAFERPRQVSDLIGSFLDRATQVELLNKADIAS
jgi:pimeloyl-ACP methyl ester carboxylesterase